MADRERDRAPEPADPEWARKTYEYVRSTWTDTERAQEAAQKAGRKFPVDVAPIYNRAVPYKPGWNWDEAARMWVPPSSAAVSSSSAAGSYKKREAELIRRAEEAQEAEEKFLADQPRWMRIKEQAFRGYNQYTAEYQRTQWHKDPKYEGDIVQKQQMIGGRVITQHAVAERINGQLVWVSIPFPSPEALKRGENITVMHVYLQGLPYDIKNEISKYL